MNEFYPQIEPYDHFLLDVGDDHHLYVEQCGNPQGMPIVFVHGGPGGGCSHNDRRFFDPEFFRIVLFDQRGCGRSLPHGELNHNETNDLIADIEKVRQHLAIDTWHVFGGSWGATLSLLYAQRHPAAVNSLTLRGIFLARQQDVDWTFDHGPATRIFPDFWQEYCAALPAGTAPSVANAYAILTGDDKAAAMTLARAWSRWEIQCCTLLPNPEFLAAATADDHDSWTLARHEAHYFVNNCFMADNEILNHCDKIAHIPTTIIHGRYDIVCPFDNAWLLHQHLPQATLIISEGAGHASVEPQTKHHLIAATQQLMMR